MTMLPLSWESLRPERWSLYWNRALVTSIDINIHGIDFSRHHWDMTLICVKYSDANFFISSEYHIIGVVVNYGISNTVVLEIP